MAKIDHVLRFTDSRPARIVLDGTSYATTGLLRCENCPFVVVHYTDPDARGPAPRVAHGLRFDALTTGRVPGCEVHRG